MLTGTHCDLQWVPPTVLPSPAMAPKAMKAMLAMKVMKAMMKKPSASGKTDYSVLTEASIMKLQGKSDTEIQQFLDGLSDPVQNLLWKKFQRSRQMQGTDDEYRGAVNGCGSKKKAQCLLKVWLKCGGDCKDALWSQAHTQLTRTSSSSQQASWRPLQYMLTYMGPKELKARVTAGTVLMRASPSDQRFPEFQEVTHSTTETTSKENVKRVEHRSNASGQSSKHCPDWVAP